MDVREVGRAGAFGFECYEDLDVGGVFFAEGEGGGEVEGVPGGEEGEGDGGRGGGGYLGVLVWDSCGGGGGGGMGEGVKGKGERGQTSSG